jgi:hypothetical protein
VQGLADGTGQRRPVTDRSGNTGSSSLDVVVNTVTPVIGINTLAADDDQRDREGRRSAALRHQQPAGRHDHW